VPDTFPSVPIDELLKRKRVVDVRAATAASMQAFSKWSGCAHTAVKFNIAGRTTASIQRHLRKRLTEAMQLGDDTPAFVGMVDAFDTPRCDDLEEMVASMPGSGDVNWDAPPVQSGLDVDLWQALHAEHCQHGCSATAAHPDCYFRTIAHFMRTGFEPTLLPDCSFEQLRPPTAAYVELWNQERTGCEAAYLKWLAESKDVISDLLTERPLCVSPLLPVVRSKHRWRFVRYGTPYKVRLCIDFKTGGLNDMVAPWRFRYRDLNDVARKLRRHDYLCTIDISSFFLRLPASKNLRRVQAFQEPDTYAATSKLNDASDSGHHWRQLNGVIFGHKTAPAWSSCVSAELARILEEHGVRVIGCFVDDLCLAAASALELRTHLDTTLRIMSELGLPPAPGKTSAISQQVVFLGMRIDSTDLTFTVSEEHRTYALALLDDLIEAGSATRQQLESLAGVLTWLSTVVSEGKPRRGEVYAELRHSESAGALAQIRLRGRLRRQLHWWRATLSSRSYDGCRCWDAGLGQRRFALIRSDASADQGWGLCIHGFHLAGSWPAALRNSSNMLFKEIFPVVVAAELFSPLMRGGIFGSVIDNSGAAFSLNRLSCRDPDTLALLRILASTLARHKCALLADWVRRVRNGHGDGLSSVAPLIPSLLDPQNTQPCTGWDFPFAVQHLQTGHARFASMRLPRDCGSGMTPSAA
jgi:hypothetical protein